MGYAEIRTLRADEIECRVSMVNEKGLGLLLYKDARADQKILDETFTPYGWKRSHQAINGNLYCTVEVWDPEKQQWIGKQDVGTESTSEKEKGQASDSFKRACFNWGLGRELYTAPFIWVPAGTAEILVKGEGREKKYYTTDRFYVRSVAYDRERCMDSLCIINSRNQVVYCMKGKIQEPAGSQPPGDTSRAKDAAGKGLSKTQMGKLKKELERTGVALEAVLERYRLRSAEQMTGEIYEKAMDCLRKSKSRDAA